MKKNKYRIIKTVGPWGNHSYETIEACEFEELNQIYYDWNQRDDLCRALYVPLLKPIQIDEDLYHWIIWKIEEKRHELGEYFLSQDYRFDLSLKNSDKIKKYLFCLKISMLANDMSSSFIYTKDDSIWNRLKRWFKRHFFINSLYNEYDFGMKKFSIDVDLAEEWLLDFIEKEIESVDSKLKKEQCSAEYYRALICLKKFSHDINVALDDYYSKMGNGIIPRADERRRFENRQKWFDYWDAAESLVDLNDYPNE